MNNHSGRKEFKQKVLSLAGDKRLTFLWHTDGYQTKIQYSTSPQSLFTYFYLLQEINNDTERKHPSTSRLKKKQINNQDTKKVRFRN